MLQDRVRCVSCWNIISKSRSFLSPTNRVHGSMASLLFWLSSVASRCMSSSLPACTTKIETKGILIGARNLIVNISVNRCWRCHIHRSQLYSLVVDFLAMKVDRARIVYRRELERMCCNRISLPSSLPRSSSRMMCIITTQREEIKLLPTFSPPKIVATTTTTPIPASSSSNNRKGPRVLLESQWSCRRGCAGSVQSWMKIIIKSKTQSERAHCLGLSQFSWVKRKKKISFKFA